MCDEQNSRWERRSWPEFKRICQSTPEAGIHYQSMLLRLTSPGTYIANNTAECHIYRRDKDLSSDDYSPMDPLFSRDPWYKHIMDNYRELRPDEVLPGHDSGCEFGSACINIGIYLPWLVSQCVKGGVVFKRAILNHISDAKSLSETSPKADFVINCTGLGSKKLGGIEDGTMNPARGQTVLVRNTCHPMVTTSGTEDGPKEVLYIMQRALGGGTILGGTYDIGNYDPVPDPAIGERIMKRAVELRPELADGKGVEGLSIVRHAVGFRPYRSGGVRIEREKMDDDTWVVHNYGHAGWGYQGSYGCAERVVLLVNEIRKQKGEDIMSEPMLFSWDQR